MCGIIGAVAYGNFDAAKDEKVRQESMIYFVSELLQLTQPRGKEATGLATMFADGDYMGLKMGISAQEFVARFGGTETDYDGYLDIWRKKKNPAKIVIGHCRKPSTGVGSDVNDNKNNHPIKVGNIIGIHNGTLINHENIFDNMKCKRDGNVDSEAIFQLLHHYTENGMEPFTKDSIIETCKRVEGTYACLSFSGNNPFQLAAFRDGRPIEACLVKPLKLLLLASEKDFLRSVIFRYNKMARLYGAGFVALKKEDILIDSLSDDSLFIFNNTTEVSKDTKLEDLFITEKILRTDKLWKKPIVASYYGHNYNRATQTPKTEIPVNNPKPATPAVPHKVGDTIDKNKNVNNLRIGMAWSNKKNEYMFINSGGEEEKHGNVEVDVEDGDIHSSESQKLLKEGSKKKLIQMENQDSSKKDFSQEFEVSEKPLDDLITDPAATREIVVVQSDEDGENRDNILFLEEHKKELHSTEIDTTIFPDVLELAQEATKREANFSNDQDLVNALEIKVPGVIANIAAYSLANRAKKYFFQRGWYAGYVTHMQESDTIDTDSSSKTLQRALTKIKSSQTSIRVLKSMIRVYDNMLNQKGPVGLSNRVDKAITKALESGEEIKTDVLRRVFKEGDIRNLSTLSCIITSIINKESR